MNDSVKYDWFWPKLKPDVVEVKKIDTKKQNEDILTKGLKKNLSLTMRKLLCGFWISLFNLHSIYLLHFEQMTTFQRVCRLIVSLEGTLPSCAIDAKGNWKLNEKKYILNFVISYLLILQCLYMKQSRISTEAKHEVIYSQNNTRYAGFVITSS